MDKEQDEMNAARLLPAMMALAGKVTHYLLPDSLRLQDYSKGSMVVRKQGHVESKRVQRKGRVWQRRKQNESSR